MADLEGGTQAFAFASGLAAISSVLELLDAGSYILSGEYLYDGTYRLFDRVRRRSAGHHFSYVDMTDLSAFEAALQDNTRMVWTETPSNPLLRLTDLAVISRICRERGIISVADNTFASPWIQQPLALGFDIVVHSSTKYLNGHSDVIGGIAVVGQNADLAERLGFLQSSVGAIAGPFDAFLTLAGARRSLEQVKLFALAESLGGVESLIEHPAIMTHASIPAENRARLGIGDGLVRLSVGVEDVEDLRADLAQALARI